MPVNIETPDVAAAQVVIDAHVHLYPGADLDDALSAGFDNLSAAAPSSRSGGATEYVLLLTETARDSAFAVLASGSKPLGKWTIATLAEDPAALVAKRKTDGARLVLVAGQQIVTSEGIEVLALTSPDRIADGTPVGDVLDELCSREIPAVLPWGVGKWIGARGQIVRDLLENRDAPGWMLGDNAGRPSLWPTPPLFRTSAGTGRPVLPGTDPLPLPGAEHGIGLYGFELSGTLSEEAPAEDLRRRLFGLRGPIDPIGARRTLFQVVAEQIALRRRKGQTRELSR